MSLGFEERRGTIHVCFNRPALPTISETDYKWDEGIHEGAAAIIQDRDDGSWTRMARMGE